MLTQAVTRGFGVVDGGTEHERTGANFDGRYVLAQWGCGSNCMRAALIDGRDGAVLALPQVRGRASCCFIVEGDPGDLRSLQFRWDSRLLGMPGGDGTTRLYVLEGHTWQYIGRQETASDLR